MNKSIDRWRFGASASNSTKKRRSRCRKSIGMTIRGPLAPARGGTARVRPASGPAIHRNCWPQRATVLAGRSFRSADRILLVYQRRTAFLSCCEPGSGAYACVGRNKPEGAGGAEGDDVPFVPYIAVAYASICCSSALSYVRRFVARTRLACNPVGLLELIVP